MKPHDRQHWILNYLRKRPTERVDILNTEFVCAYVEATQAKYLPQFYGAPKCKTLGSDLGELARSEMLRRVTVGLPSAWVSQSWYGATGSDF